MGDAPIGRDRVIIDVDEVEAVAAFYRRAALVISAAAADLAGHSFGSWAVGEWFGDLGERFGAMSAQVSDRLSGQAQAAVDLADLLARGVTEFALADTSAEREFVADAETPR
ncbi:MAG: hypothetical protein QM673_13060 [Gordonia sp. (in: high G+C Gram-positive bacteria)]